jgi:hypothetical protein
MLWGLVVSAVVVIQGIDAAELHVIVHAMRTLLRPRLSLLVGRHQQNRQTKIQRMMIQPSALIWCIAQLWISSTHCLVLHVYLMSPTRLMFRSQRQQSQALLKLPQSPFCFLLEQMLVDCAMFIAE